jgi:DNA topoisomerase-3
VWGNYVADLLPNNWTRPKAGVDVGDHPPITPCRYASSSDLYGEQGRLYDLVVKHFLASVSPGTHVLMCAVLNLLK